jgi:hypothetical protein
MCPVLRQRMRLGQIAEKLAMAWYLEANGFVSAAMHSSSAAAWHAMLLAGAFDHYGCVYEDLASLTNLEVADIVVALTVDTRLPLPKRILMHTGVLGQASPCAQIVRLVQLRASLHTARSHLLAAPDRYRHSLAAILPEYQKYLAAMRQLGQHTTTRQAWNDARALCEGLLRAIDRWRKYVGLVDNLRARGHAVPCNAIALVPVREAMKNELAGCE